MKKVENIEIDLDDDEVAIVEINEEVKEVIQGNNEERNVDDA